MTVHRALRELKDDGWLRRVQGQGTFVADRRTRLDLLEIRNIADVIRSRGTYGCDVVLHERSRPTADIAEELEVEPDADLFHSRLVHYLDGAPFQLEDRWVNPAAAPDYLGVDLTQQTPNEYLMHAAPLSEVEHRLEAVLPGPLEQELLGIGRHQPCLLLHRRTWSAGRVASRAWLTPSGRPLLPGDPLRPRCRSAAIPKTGAYAVTDRPTGNIRLDNTREIRAPHGDQLSCKSWLTEAPMRMLMNNLDAEVAEKPQELVVYGGIGRAARNWESYDRIVAALRALEADETLLVQSGKPVGVFRTHADAPRVLIANSNIVPHWATLETFNELDRAGLNDVRPDDSRLLDLYRQPGHRSGHLRDLRRGRPAALRRRPFRPLDTDRRPGRHGRRAADGGDHGWRLPALGRMPAEPHRDAAEDRLSRPADDRSG